MVVFEIYNNNNNSNNDDNDNNNVEFLNWDVKITE